MYSDHLYMYMYMEDLREYITDSVCTLHNVCLWHMCTDTCKAVYFQMHIHTCIVHVHVCGTFVPYRNGFDVVHAVTKSYSC